MMVKPAKKRASRWWYLLLIVQFPALLAVPLFNRLEPEWQGIPFFYWYQLLWIILGASLTATVYFVMEHKK
jgi:hypothetical protein